MASNTTITTRRRNIAKRRAGRKRKSTLGQKSTLSYQELFADFGEPGQKQSAKTK